MVKSSRAGRCHSRGKRASTAYTSQRVSPRSSVLQIFLDSLLRGMLAISQLHVLVTNDAQLIKDQDSHPMVRVMNEFYRVTDPLSQPKILAMVTPPSDRQFHYDSGMLKLEETLDAKVFGVSGDKRTAILALPDRPSEAVVLYNPPPRIAETRLFKELLKIESAETVFSHYFRASRLVLLEAGSCASDLVWRRAIKEIEASITPVYEEDEDGPDQARILVARTRIRVRDVVTNWAFAMPNLRANSKGFNVTPKFLKLVHILKSCEPYGDGFRGVVFGVSQMVTPNYLSLLNDSAVQHRATAFVLVDLLKTLGDIGFIRPYAIVGQGRSADPRQVLSNPLRIHSHFKCLLPVARNIPCIC
jgi:endoribonuclease Dicer